MACTTEEILKALREGENERVEFKKRLPSDIGKEIVAFANTSGGIILIGIDDSGEVVGTDESIERVYSLSSGIVPKVRFSVSEVRIGDKRILCIKVSPSKHLHSWRNIAYLRVGPHSRPLEIQEVLEKAYESGTFAFEKLPNPQADLEDLDKALLKEYLGILGLRYTRENLVKVGVLNKKGEITNAGVLLFAHDPSLFIPEAYVEIIFESEREQIRGPLEKQWKKALQFTLERVKKEFVPTLKGTMYIPKMAIREALLNALIHKNYLSASPVLVKIQKEGKITVRNPGSFPPGVSIDNPVHKARNPMLCDYFLRKGYMEKLGIGIELMRRDAEKHGWSLSITPGDFYTTVVLEATRSIELSEKESAVFKAVLEGKEKAKDISEVLGMSKRSVLRVLEKLISQGLVKRVGKGKGTKYVPAQEGWD